MSDDDKTLLPDRLQERLGRPVSEVYFSVDVETDGPVPGLHSMLSIGVVVLDPRTLDECGEFYRTIRPLDGATQDRDTMKWWAGFPEQYAATRTDAKHPSLVMHELDEWVDATTARFAVNGAKPTPIFVAYPVAFDFGFYRYYAHRFVGRSVFGFVGLDVASLAMGYNGGLYDDQTKKKWPEEWVTPADRVAIHHALDDARQQADIFRRILQSTVRRRMKGAP